MKSLVERRPVAFRLLLALALLGLGILGASALPRTSISAEGELFYPP